MKKINKNYLIIYIFLIFIVILLILILSHMKIISNDVSNTANIILTGINAYIASLTAKYTKESSQYQRESNNEDRKNIISNQATKIYTHMIQRRLKPHHPIKNAMGPLQPVLIGNSSNQPIYNALIISCFNKFKYSYMHKDSDIQLTRNPSFIIFFQILMPGTYYKTIRTYGCSSGGTRPAAMIVFTDSKGYKWLRDPQGNLIHIKNYNKVCKYCHIFPSDLWMASASEFTKTYKNLQDLYADYSYNQK